MAEKGYKVKFKEKTVTLNNQCIVLKAKTLTEESAVNFLKISILKESDFEVLPSAYKVEKKVKK